MGTNMTNRASCKTFWAYLSSKLPIKAIAAKFNTINQNILGHLLFKISPALFKHFLSSVKMMFEYDLTTYGTPNKVQQTMINAHLGHSALDRNAVTIVPKLIPNQNIRFQKLSLFNLAWIKPFLGCFGLSYIPPYSLGATVVLTDRSGATCLGEAICVFLRFAQKLVKFSMTIMSNFWFQKSYSFSVSKQLYLRKRIINLILGFFVSILPNVAFASSNIKDIDENLKNFIQVVEHENQIPSGLLLAIASVESGYHPYAINVAGKPVFARNAAQATYHIEKALSSGINNIDIGMTQINYRWHKENFNNIQEMLNPKTNIKYAGKLLARLYKKHGSWHKALRYYHSANSTNNRKYSRKITIEWLGIRVS